MSYTAEDKKMVLESIFNAWMENEKPLPGCISYDVAFKVMRDLGIDTSEAVADVEEMEEMAKLERHLIKEGKEIEKILDKIDEREKAAKLYPLSSFVDANGNQILYEHEAVERGQRPS